MIKKNDVVELTVSAVTCEGFGLCRYTDSDLAGFVVYVPATAIGDVILCRIVKKLSSYAFGKLEKLLSPSAARIEADCPVFGKCGGCSYRHVSYEEELKYKRDTAVDAYRRVFGTEGYTVSDCVGSPKTVGYRNKVQFPVTEGGKCGFYKGRSHQSVSVEGCKLHAAAFEPVIRAFEEYVKKSGATVYDEETGKGCLRHLYLRYGEDSGEVCVCAVANADTLPKEALFCEIMQNAPGVCGGVLCVNKKNTNVILSHDFRVLFGKDRVHDRLCGIELEVSMQSFYQVNKAQAERIYTDAVEMGVSKEDRVLDLYCGIGGIAMVASKRAKEVFGVEIVSEAIEDARRTAKANGIENCAFAVSDAAKLNAVLEAESFVPDTVIVDPPRKGLDEETVAAIVKILPKKIVYVSCNPYTQARNVKQIMDEAKKAGAEYTLSPITPYDMFPRTTHVETVVCLCKQ